jgi:acid phosphatase
LDIVKETYANTKPTYNYTSPFPYDTVSDYNTKVTATKKNVTGTQSSPSSSPSASPNAAVSAVAPAAGVSGLLLGLALSLL